MLWLCEINQRLKVYLVELYVTIQGTVITPFRLPQHGCVEVQAEAQVRTEIAISQDVSHHLIRQPCKAANILAR